MSSYQEIIKNLHILQTHVRNDSRLKLFYLLNSTLLMLIFWGIALIPVLLYTVSDPINGLNAFMIFWIIIIPWSILYLRDYLKDTLPKKIIRTYVDNITHLVESTQNLVNETSSTEEVCEQVEFIQTEIVSINSKRKFLWMALMKEITRKSLNTSFNLITNWVLFILTDLRSDLKLCLTEQQKTLEQAKSEVEQNIHGTTELEQVSELQKARLDRQIEQFEELQKVLVKV